MTEPDKTGAVLFNSRAVENMNYVFLLIATLASTLKSIMCKKIGNDSKNKKRMFLYNGTIFAVAAAIILIALCAQGVGVLNISRYSFLLALLFAFVTLFTQSSEILAMKCGSISMTMMIFSCGFLIPIFYGVAFLNEGISPLQIIGLAVLIAALVMIISPKKSERISVRWLILSVLAMLGSGINAIIQKIHQASVHKGELMQFLFWALIFSSLFSFIASFLTRGAASERNLSKKHILEAGIFLAFCGICVGVLNILNLHLAGKLPAVIQFPIYSIGSLILTGLAGRFIYKERMTARKLIGFCLGCVAITVIALL